MHDEGRYRVIVESIEILCSTEVAREILDNALRVSGRRDVPSPADGLHAFLDGYVLDAIEARLGPETADQFEEDMEQVLRAATHEKESVPPPRRGARGPLLFVASTERARIEAISAGLAHHADVEGLEDGDALSAVLTADLAKLVVLDCKHCSLDATALDALCQSLPRTQVVLWGAEANLEASLMAAQRTRGGTWVSCAARAAPSHVAGMVLALLTHAQ